MEHQKQNWKSWHTQYFEMFWIFGVFWHVNYVDFTAWFWRLLLLQEQQYPKRSRQSYNRFSKAKTMVGIADMHTKLTSMKNLSFTPRFCLTDHQWTLFSLSVYKFFPSQVNWQQQTDRQQTDHEQTDREVTISLHNFLTDFVAVISSQSEGLGKMALGIVKIYLGSQFSANWRCSRSVCLRSVGLQSVCCDQLSKTCFLTEL